EAHFPVLVQRRHPVNDLTANKTSASLVDEFLASVESKSTPTRGSLIVAIDATASREPTWDMAAHLQAQMFQEVATIGSLDVELIFFRGATGIDAECKASPWVSDPKALAAYMTGIKCRAGL